MTDKDFKRLNKQELLELLLAQSQRIDRLQARIESLQKQLEEREVLISNAGSIAEASLRLNRIFEDAQAAADQYLYNVKLMAAGRPADSPKTGITDISDYLPGGTSESTGTGGDEQ